MGLLLLTGPPGSGKSSVAPILARDATPSAIVPGDTFFGFLYRGGIDPWRPEADEQNTAVIESAAAAAGRLARRMHVVFEGVLDPSFLPAFLAAAGLDELDYAVLLPDVETCLHRVATRAGHDFADAAATRHMHRQFAAAHLDARHVITDAPASPGESAALVRHRRAEGRLTVRRPPAAP